VYVCEAAKRYDVMQSSGESPGAKSEHGMCIQITSFGELVVPRNSCNSYGFFCRVQAAHNNNTILFIIIIRGFLIFVTPFPAVFPPFVLLVTVNTVGCK
jgi:hypothetical protein